MRKLVTALGLLALLGFPGWGQSQRPKVVATFLPMYWFTKGVVGDRADVEVLVPPGMSAHEYQATPANARTLAQANVVVMNGLGLEEFMTGLLKNVGKRNLRVIDASKGIQPLKEEGHKHNHGHDHKHGHGHSHSAGNPHVWLDPVLAIQQVNNIRDGLVAADPPNAPVYKTNAANFIKQLQNLDQEFRNRLAPVRGCKFIAFHDAFPYLAKRYGLQQMAVVELPEDVLKPQDIQRVKSAAQKFPVKALLSEPGVDDKRLQQIAQELKLPVRTLDPLERGELQSDYYFRVMRQNLATLEAVCK
ncbi:MAG: zinc ABC transporter substrate-binding protein [Pseudanabaenaceae cyanobacterium SKYGB_i_bin29]|nr:zinc ABC transporter substrate-binding protein [Pseudanabaenaceae cyanobacterium SKYG29]MDW8420968.1 zinc ABC transporter substrate-binding protein [Pseudanabaenaceae cyanobacterium SKYGB_i_bin29]